MLPMRFRCFSDGIAGENYGTITDCTNKGKVTGQYARDINGND